MTESYALIRQFFLPAYFVVIYLLEWGFAARVENKKWRHDARNIFFGLLNLAVVASLGIVLTVILNWTSLHKFGLFNLFSDYDFARFTLELLTLDLFMYLWHRLNHQLPLLWKFHAFHHADTQMNATTALRFHAVEIGFSIVVRALLFPLLGISIVANAWYSIVLMVIVVFHHANIKVPQKLDATLNYIIVAPGMHRVHHSKRHEESNSNFGSILSIWDKLFKTHRKNNNPETITFGV